MSNPLLRVLTGFGRLAYRRVSRSATHLRRRDPAAGDAAIARAGAHARDPSRSDLRPLGTWRAASDQPGARVQFRWTTGDRQDDLRRGDRSRARQAPPRRSLRRGGVDVDGRDTEEHRCDVPPRAQGERRAAVRRGGRHRVATFVVTRTMASSASRTRRSTCCCRSSNASMASSFSPPTWRRTSIRRSSAESEHTCSSKCLAPSSVNRSGECRCTPGRRWPETSISVLSPSSSRSVAGISARRSSRRQWRRQPRPARQHQSDSSTPPGRGHSRSARGKTSDATVVDGGEDPGAGRRAPACSDTWTGILAGGRDADQPVRDAAGSGCLGRLVRAIAETETTRAGGRSGRHRDTPTSPSMSGQGRGRLTVRAGDPRPSIPTARVPHLPPPQLLLRLPLGRASLR